MTRYAVRECDREVAVSPLQDPLAIRKKGVVGFALRDQVPPPFFEGWEQKHEAESSHR